jgi:hypothetical protein
MKRERHPEAYDYMLSEGFTPKQLDGLWEEQIIGAWERHSLDDLEKVGMEVELVEMKALRLQNLENLDMYEDGIFEMYKYEAESSGLPYTLWFDDAGEVRMNKHKEPRVKAELPSENLIPISIEEKPRLLLEATLLTKAEREIDWEKMSLIFAFISRNHKLLLQHWDGEIYNTYMINNLVRD